MKAATDYKETVGTICNLQIQGQDFPSILTVSYVVDGERFQIKESIKLKSEKIKLGPFTIGQRRIACLGETRVGTNVRVFYKEDDPHDAFLPDNQGMANI